MRHFWPFFVNFHGFEGDTDCPRVSNPGYVVYSIYGHTKAHITFSVQLILFLNIESERERNTFHFIKERAICSQEIALGSLYYG